MRKILGALRRADDRFGLIENGDKIAVGLSGGVDSMTMLYALSLYKRFRKKNYSLHAITVDLGFGNYDTATIQRFARDVDVPLTVIPTQIAEIVFDIRKEKNPCALCAKMRKGALYEKAAALGCNKAAFAHNADEAMQTLVMSLLYEARMNTFSPKSHMSRRNVTLVRPFITLRKKDITDAARRRKIPVAKNPCPIDFATKREEAKGLLQSLEEVKPGAQDNILRALLNTDGYHLWDK